VPFDRARVAADKQLQPPFSRGGDPTAHRRLKDFHSLADGLVPNRLRGCGGIAGHVDPGRASSQRLKGTVRTQHRRLDIHGPGQHGDQHVRRRGCLRRGRPPARPARCRLSFTLGPFVGRDHLISGPDQGRAHGHAHPAQPDKGDLRHRRVLPPASAQNHQDSRTQRAAQPNGIVLALDSREPRGAQRQAVARAVTPERQPPHELACRDRVRGGEGLGTAVSFLQVEPVTCLLDRPNTRWANGAQDPDPASVEPVPIPAGSRGTAWAVDPGQTLSQDCGELPRT
jgi:hypothetical protein